MTNELKHNLEWELHKKNKENSQLKQQLSDTHMLLYDEKQEQLNLKSQIQSLQCIFLFKLHYISHQIHFKFLSNISKKYTK